MQQEEEAQQIEKHVYQRHFIVGTVQELVIVKTMIGYLIVQQTNGHLTRSPAIRPLCSMCTLMVM